MTVAIPFVHRQTAHCESGVTANMLKHYGFDLSEAMTFGLGAGLYFAWLPIIKVNYLPLIAFRSPPGFIIRAASKKLGARFGKRSFRRPADAEAALDEKLAAGIPVGLQTSVFWLPYFPPAYRFHFNAHNLVVYGKEDGDYLVSDPTFEDPVRCPAADLSRARWAKGTLAPKGKMYWLESPPTVRDVRPLIPAAVRSVGKYMVDLPVGFLGAKGIRMLARRIALWPKKLGPKKARAYLAHIIRLSEEVGTGGAGFRFLYAAFLAESAKLLSEPLLKTGAVELAKAGDLWRSFALDGARLIKNRTGDGLSPSNLDAAYAGLSQTLLKVADAEAAVFADLYAWAKREK